MVVVAVLAAACGVDLDDRAAPAPAPGNAPSTSVDSGSGPTRLSDWSPCPDGDDELECAALTVPLDWDDAGGDTIELKVGRSATTGSDRVGSLVFNPGGPGEPGVGFLQDLLASDGVPEGLAERFDLVSWDPRGTGGSSPIACTPDAERERPGPDPTPDDASEEDELANRSVDEVARCVDRHRRLIAEVGTRNTARDLDALRDALGDPELSYVGYSYGTLIGQVYLSMFGDRVRAMVLDGLVVAGADPVVQAEEQLASFESSLDAFLDSCASSRRCFGDGEPRAALEELIERLEGGERIPADYEFGGADREGTLGIGEIYDAIVVALYSRETWGVLQQGLERAMGARPDGDILLFLRDTYRGRDPETGEWNNLFDAFSAIGCADQEERADDPLGDRAVGERLRQEHRFFGALFALGLPGCHGFPAAEEPVEALAPGAISDVAPVVLVSSTGDPATPYEHGARVQEVIDGSVLVTWEGNDHTAYGRASACLDAPITRYLIDLDPPEDGLRCQP